MYAPLVGIYARDAHLSFIVTLLMTILMTAGTAQLVAIQLMSHGQTLLAITWMTIIVNARHLVMGLSLYPHIKQYSIGRRFLLAWTLNDESYAMASRHLNKVDMDIGTYLIANATVIYLAFYLGVIVGWIAGNLIATHVPLVIPLIFPFLLVAIVVHQIQGNTPFMVILPGALITYAAVSFGAGIQWLVPIVVVANTIVWSGNYLFNKHFLGTGA